MNAKARESAIRNLARACRISDEKRDAWIANGTTLEQVAEEVLQICEARPQKLVVTPHPEFAATMYKSGLAYIAQVERNMVIPENLARQLQRAVAKKRSRSSKFVSWLKRFGRHE